MIDCVAMSDLHGYLPKDIKPFDLMLLAGDIVDLYSQSSVNASRDWYLEEFVPWVNNLPFKDEYSEVILIAGNHELGLYRMKPEQKELFLIALKERSDNRVVYLENQFYQFPYIDGTRDTLMERIQYINIFGTPYCKEFGRWAFLGTRYYLDQKFSEIPENVDILLTHDAPYGVSDECYGWIFQGRTPEHIGSPALRDAILEKKPKMCIHAHLHTSNHEFEQLGDTKVINVSLLDEEYRVTYEPLYFKWPLQD